MQRRNDWTLSATVGESDPGWFRIDLLVSSEKEKKLQQPVMFHLHSSFPSEVETKKPGANGTVKLTLHAYGAFTVGAVIGDDGTELELDLATLEGAPPLFRSR